MIFLNNASLCPNFPIPVPNLHTLIRFSTFVIPRKSSIKIPATYINNTFLIRVRGQAWKLASTTVTNGRTHGNEHDSERKQHQFPDDNLMHGNYNETEKESTAPLPVTHQYYHQNLVDKMKAVQSYVIAMEQWNASMLKMCHRNYSRSAANLIHYLALKSLDMEQTKEDGLHSSNGVLNLETINPNVLSTLSARTQMLMITSRSDSIKKILEFSYPRSDELSMMKMAHHNRDSLLGTLEGHKLNHIMVTIGKEAIENDTHIADLIDAGTTIFRINCAHGNAEIWSQIIVQVKKSSQLLEKPCRILMDLAGPKLRTGKLKDNVPFIAIISPKWDIIHNVLRPAQVWLCSKGTTPPANASPDFIFHVDGQEFLSNLKVDDIIRFSDARGKQRTFKISRGYHNYTDTVAGVGFMAECSKNAYVESGTELYVKAKGLKPLVGFVVDVPPVQQFVRVKIGDLLVISRDGNSDELLEDKSVLSSIHADHVITCESDYLFDSVKPGDRIAFDDGKIWGVIQETRSSQVVVSITHADPKGTKLRSEKSINIPDSIDSRYKGVSLTSKDLDDLEFVASHADMVGISFVRNVHDVVMLSQELEKRKFSNLGIVLKIETKEGHENLPLLILEAMKLSNPLGIMIARGDLAVECGWEKLGDIQEEIISICKASHLPVILATQVLDSLVKSGVPTRPEITDAVNGRRASCVMLNKGKHIVKGVTTLEAILNRR